jgi:predicted ATPase
VVGEDRQVDDDLGLFERSTEVGAIAAAVDAAREGQGHGLVIEGAAGVGKSRLLAEARGQAATAGMRVLSRVGDWRGG